MLQTKTLFEFQKFTESICLESGQILLRYRGKAQVLRTKSDQGDIVTEADEASEKHIISRLKKTYPSHSYLSEESGQSQLKSDFRWVIDPLDGTKEFAKGVPLFTVNLALEYRQEIILSIVYCPVTHEVFSSAKGFGATLNGRSIHVSDIDTLGKSIIYAHPPKGTESEINFDRQWKKLKTIAKCVYRLKTGSADQFYCPWVALGAYEAYWLSVNYPSWWDVAPLILLVIEAGGKVTTSKGNAVTEINFKTEGILATNGKIHSQLLQLINS